MPDWLPGLVVAAIAIIPGIWREVGARRKGRAEADNVIVQSYKSLVADLRQQIEEEQQGREICGEELQNAQDEMAQLRDENGALVGYVQRLTAGGEIE